MEPTLLVAVLGVLAVAVASLVVGLVTLAKVREIDQATRALAVASRATRIEAETLFRQLQALLALERKLGLPEALPALRGWAGSPDFLLCVAEEIDQRRPRTVVECGSGVSTIVCARMLQLKGAGHLFSLEHERVFADATQRLLSRYGLTDWASVIHAPLDTARSPTPWYAESAIPKTVSDIDLLIVDGPPASVGPLARYPALPVLAGRLAADPIVIVDDTMRDDEREMLRLWAEEFPRFAQHPIPCEKGCVRLSARIG